MNLQNLKRTLGPGILFASTAIGVSHLVQSTRAGADYGFALVWAVVLANIFKYPFFEFASRYANVKNKSILHGYKEIGTWALYAYLGLSLVSMFVVAAAVSFVCSGLMAYLLGIDVPIEYIALVLYMCCALILLKGKYGFLDGFIKAISVLLLITVLVAFIVTLLHGPLVPMDEWKSADTYSRNGWIFIIALMGWMPTAVDLSAWGSIWTVERIKQSGYHPSLKETLLDFNIGYTVSALLSLCFLTLGAYFMFGSGVEFSNSSVQFASQLIQLFTMSIGQWSKWIIAIAAFSVMLSTTITVFDGYARALSESSRLLGGRGRIQSYTSWLMLVLIESFIILMFFVGQLRSLVDLATIVSFLIASLIAFFNYKLVFKNDFPPEHRPSRILKTLALAGLVYLIVFGLVFLFILFSS